MIWRQHLCFLPRLRQTPGKTFISIFRSLLGPPVNSQGFGIPTRLNQVPRLLCNNGLMYCFNSLESGVAILTEISLTPLFMSTASVLNMTSGPKGRRMQWILILLHVPLLISLILIVAGGIDPDSREGPTFASTELTKAGISIYCASFVILIWATCTIAARLYLANPVEVKILTTVVLSLPFFLVDVVYMMCFAFQSQSGDQRFNVISGSVTIQLCM